MPGRHFAANALGVFALVDASVRHGLLRCPDYRPARVLELLGEFPGVERRMEYLGDLRGARVYDDYGHHPTEIAAVLDACRLRLGQRGRVIAVFQPHRYTRTRALYREFAEVLRRADLIFLLPLYSAGEAPIEGVGSALILGAGGEITSSVADGVGPEASPASGGRFTLLEQPDCEARFAAVFAEVRPGDLVICLGAGDISAGIRQYMAVALRGLQP
jgi:UDP-N-acetylmuramate--alanine ligase